MLARSTYIKCKPNHLLTEHYAIRERFLAANELQGVKFIIASDRRETINLVLNLKKECRHDDGLVAQIGDLIHGTGCSRVLYNRQDSNKHVHSLAKYALSCKHLLNWFRPFLIVSIFLLERTNLIK